MVLPSETTQLSSLLQNVSPCYLYHTSAKIRPALGRAVALSNQGLVYGGGFSGLMGAVAKSALQNGSQVTGIIPVAMVAAGAGFENVGDFIDQELSERVDHVCILISLKRIMNSDADGNCIDNR